MIKIQYSKNIYENGRHYYYPLFMIYKSLHLTPLIHWEHDRRPSNDQTIFCLLQDYRSTAAKQLAVDTMILWRLLVNKLTNSMSGKLSIKLLTTYSIWYRRRGRPSPVQLQHRCIDTLSESLVDCQEFNHRRELD